MGTAVAHLRREAPSRSIMVEVTSLADALAAAGGINAGNARAYAKAGVGIFATSTPDNAAPTDIQVTINAL